MNEDKAKIICEKNGSTLSSYKLGSGAFLILPSGEPIMISVGTATAKVFTKRPIFGWHFPKVIVSQPIKDWEPTFPTLDRLHRYACVAMVLDGLLSLLAPCKSIAELRLEWPVLLRDPRRHPIAVAAMGSFDA
jgi:hypothetical protein